MTKISFIVVAYNAAQSLDALLGDLLAQTVDPRQLEALLATFACIVAPSRFVLYGDFLTDGMAERLEQYVCRRLSGKFRVQVEVSSCLEEDYETGMICLAQNRMLQLMEERTETNTPSQV